jgi:hypothetical protein
LSQARAPLAAPIAASRIVAAESQIAVRTSRGRAWALVRATIEVELVAVQRTTALQPRLVSSEAST